jgi:hypothetical protein
VPLPATKEVFFAMADKLSDKEIERRKQQAALKAAQPKPHESFVQAKGKSGPKPVKARIQRHQGR